MVPVYFKAMDPQIQWPGLWESALGRGQAGGGSAGLGMISGLNLHPETWMRKASLWA